MEKFKEIETKTIVKDNMETETETKTKLHIIRKWDELTREEQEEEINRRQEAIYMLYQEDLYNQFKCDLDNLKYDFKNISFDDVYLDSNSQGWWIDSIKNFKYHTEGIEIFGEYLDVYDVDFHIRKYIDEFEIEIDDYYVDSEKLEKIKNTKKYKNWINNIKTDIQKWVDLVNEFCKDIGDKEYYCPYNLDDEEDKEYLDFYFMDMEFEKIEECE